MTSGVVRPPAFDRFTIVSFVFRDWLKTTYLLEQKIQR